MRSTESLTILIVDEDPTSLFLTKELLQYDGHTVYATTMSVGGIAEFDKYIEQIQIVFCDAAVVRTKGTYLFDELRRKIKEVMIVVMASPSDLLKIGSMIERYNVKILLKPYSGRMLLEFVNAVPGGLINRREE